MQRTHPGRINLNDASPEEILEHIFKVGQYANGGTISVGDFFEGNLDQTYSGTGVFRTSFPNLGEVSYEFRFLEGGILDFGTVDVIAGYGNVELGFIDVSDGTRDLSVQTGRMGYNIEVAGNRTNSGISYFRWTSHNAFTGEYPDIRFAHLNGYRLSLYLTYRFTGRYRKGFP